MGLFKAIILLTFVTLPSLLYGILHAILVFLISLPLRLFTGGDKAVFLSDAISVKFLTPALLLIVLPIVFYFHVWVPLTWIFFGWMLLYFILRRYSGVSKQHAQIDHTLKEYDSFMSDIHKRTHNIEKTDKDTEQHS